MKISNASPVNGITRARRLSPSSAASGDDIGEVRDIQDTATIMGIPPEEMTPKVRSAIMNLMQEVDKMRRDFEMAQRRISELEKLADQDSLAPIANRRAFVREMSRMMSFADRYNIPTSLIFLDVNGLKTINDTYGHAAGDAVLMHVATVLAANVRDSDIIGRLGGDEFGIILPNSNEENAQIKAQKLSDAIKAAPVEWNGKLLSVSAAHGAYSFQPGSDPTTALAEADKKMYAQKRETKTMAG